MRKTSRFDRPITLRIRVDGLYLCVAMGSPARPFECRAAIFSRFVVNLFVSVPDGSSERKRFLTRCPTPCGRKFVLPRIVGIPANARLRAVSPELVANTIFGCSAPKGCQRRRTDGDAHPERKSPAQAARRPLRRSARTDRSDPPRGAPCATPKPQVRWYRDLRFDDGPRANPFLRAPRFSLPERASRLPRRLASRTGIRPDGRKGGFL